MKDFYVYLHSRKTDGKIFYVGKGRGKRAFEKNGRRNFYWNRVVEKHGYTVEIYLDGLQEWYAFELEKELIAYYGRDKLTNGTDGGDGTSGHIVSEEMRKISSARFSGKNNPMHNEKNKKYGDSNPMRNPDVAKKVSNKTKGIHRNWAFGKNHYNAKKILCVEKNMYFDSIMDACRFYQYKSPGSIVDCCKGKDKKAYGYTWKYVDEK